MKDAFQRILASLTTEEKDKLRERYYSTWNSPSLLAIRVERLRETATACRDAAQRQIRDEFQRKHPHYTPPPSEGS